VASSSGNWISGAVKRPGAFGKKASAAGMSTQAYAKKEAHDPKASSRTKKQANLTLTFSKMRKSSRGGRNRKSGRR